MIIPMMNRSNIEVGHYNTKTKTYHRIIDWSLRQGFIKFNALGCSNHILKSLNKESCRCEKFDWWLLNHPDYGSRVQIEISFIDFLKNSTSIKFNERNCDPQRMCKLKYWKVIPLDQKRLLVSG